jgi:hypothetical protein
MEWNRVAWGVQQGGGWGGVRGGCDGAGTEGNSWQAKAPAPSCYGPVFPPQLSRRSFNEKTRLPAHLLRQAVAALLRDVQHIEHGSTQVGQRRDGLRARRREGAGGRVLSVGA